MRVINACLIESKPIWFPDSMVERSHEKMDSRDVWQVAAKLARTKILINACEPFEKL